MVSSKRDVYDGIHLYPFTDLDTCTSWQVVYLMFIPCRLWCRVVSKHIISYHHCCSSIWNSRLFLRIGETMKCCDQMSIHPVPSIFSQPNKNFSRWTKTPPTHPLHTKTRGLPRNWENKQTKQQGLLMYRYSSRRRVVLPGHPTKNNFQLPSLFSLETEAHFNDTLPIRGMSQCRCSTK